MDLSGENRKQLYDALIDAFANKSSLQQMISFGLNENLDKIASGTDLKEIIFNLITTAESQGWVEELISAAYRANPGNFNLQVIYQKLCIDLGEVEEKDKNEIRDNREEPLPWIVKKLKEFVIGFYSWTRNPKFQRDYYRTLIDVFRELKIEGFRIGLPVLDLEDVFVPLRVDSEIPDKIPGRFQTVNSLSLAVDCLEESLKVEPEVRKELEEMLDEGLESPEPEIFKLVAEVKLSRRLNNLREIDENTEIVLGYITHAEYQLFVDEQLNSQSHFPPGSSKIPITKISQDNAFNFCNWLTSKTSFIKTGNDDIYYYRLPTGNEMEDNLATKYSQLTCWNIRGSSQQENGIRVVREKLPSEYTKLFKYLAASEWVKASQETEKIILKAAKQESGSKLNTLIFWCLCCCFN